MKKFKALLFFGLMAPFLLRANPIELRIFSEIYFEGDDWFIELVHFNQLFGESSLDNFGILCSSGSAQFKPGIDVTESGWVIITQDSMLSPLAINKYGDFIQFRFYHNGSWNTVNSPTYFGDMEDSQVNYPFEGQSIVNTTIIYGQNWMDFWTVKENDPTLGSSFYQVTTYGTLSGRVLNQNLEPVAGIQVQYCPPYFLGQSLSPIFTDNEGYFCSPPEMLARNYAISLIWNETSLLDTCVTVEPDSTTWCDYILDTVLVKVPSSIKGQELSFGNFPNPFSDNTTFVIQLPEDTHYQEGRIIVYDMTGREVYDRVIGQEMTGTAPVFHHWDLAGNPASVSPGEYISCLVLDGIVVAKNKSTCVR
ncbi:MAG TPA: hypothetical protein PK711_01170 [Bacteroidales bacterium]|nr:hypothetical protein [Bacteroidales bacterium]HRZ20105.1 hypothetical protein [Bacteroidales bacterium]